MTPGRRTGALAPVPTPARRWARCAGRGAGLVRVVGFGALYVLGLLGLGILGPACATAPAQTPAHASGVLPPPPATGAPIPPPAGVVLRLTAAQKQAVAADLAAGQAAFAVGAYEEAEHAWLRAAQVDPSNVAVRLGLGRVWLLRGVAGDDALYCARAREAFLFVVESCPDHDQARRLLSLLAPPPTR